MRDAVQWGRSLIFTINIYAAMPVFGIVFLPWALVSRQGAIAACKSWSYYTLWCAKWMVGIRYEVRGTPPADEVMIASKHQSFLDIILIFISIPAGKLIMKRELMFAWQTIRGHKEDGRGCRKGGTTARAADHLSARHTRSAWRQIGIQSGHRGSL